MVSVRTRVRWLIAVAAFMAALIVGVPAIARAADPLTVSTASLGGGQVGTAYTQTLAATGGTTPYAWTVTTGTLPAGLTLSTAGVIAGTPTTVGTASFTVQAADAATPALTATKALTIAVTAAPLAIGTASLPDGQIGAGYAQTLAATGGTAPYLWTITSGMLPAGIALNTSTGLISGTPTTAGLRPIVVQVTDAAAGMTVRALSINITSVPTALSVSTASLANASVGVAYARTLTAAGGSAPYTWSIGAGILPAGLVLDANSGMISGAPSTGGSTSFAVQVTDSTGTIAAKTLTLTVNSSTPTPVPTPRPGDGRPSVPPTYRPFDRDDRPRIQDFFYGTGLRRGDRVSAYINGLLCASTTVERSGQWSILVRADSRCAPVTGSPVAFTLNGVPATSSPAAVWQPRALPLSTYGYVLTPTSTPTPVGSTSADFAGTGLTAGAQLAALVNGVSCASTTVSSSGAWSLSIGNAASCLPTAGAVVTFTLNGAAEVATPAAIWQPGGNGTYALTGAGTSTVPVDQLPYQAYGVGLTPGKVVVAYDHGTAVGNATVDASGNWVFNIPASAATNGDTLTFTVGGQAANETAVFQAGQFALPPGITLTLAAGGGTGSFSSTPNFGTGNAAQVVFTGGSVDQLESATSAGGGAGAWVQDASGVFHLLIVGGPSFLKEAFSATFPGGFATMTAVTITRH